MEEKEKSNYGLENLVRYRPAAVATQFYQDKNPTAAKGALEKLATTLDVGKDGGALLEAIREGKEGDKTLANIYAKSYEEALMGNKVGELFKFYSDYFKEYITGDSYKEAETFFEKYANESYKDMFAKVIEAQEKLNSKSPKVTDEDRKKAQETLMKYSKITTPIQTFEKLEMDKLSGPIEKDALKKDFTEMFKPKSE